MRLAITNFYLKLNLTDKIYKSNKLEAYWLLVRFRLRLNLELLLFIINITIRITITVLVTYSYHY